MDAKPVAVEIVLPRLWAEKDMFGTVHIKVQHDGLEEFDFVQIKYRYGYVDNASQAAMTKQVLAMLGVEWDGKYEISPLPQSRDPKEGAA